MRGHVDAKGSIAVHEGPSGLRSLRHQRHREDDLERQGWQTIGEITYKPDDVIVFSPNTWHGWVNGDAPFEFLGFDMPAAKKLREPKLSPNQRANSDHAIAREENKWLKSSCIIIRFRRIPKRYALPWA